MGGMDIVKFRGNFREILMNPRGIFAEALEANFNSRYAAAPADDIGW